MLPAHPPPELLELCKKREKEQGIVPDPDVAAFMDAITQTGKQSMVTQLMLRLLGLDICEDTVVRRPGLGLPWNRGC